MNELMESFLATKPYDFKSAVEEDGWNVIRWEVRAEPPDKLRVIYADLLNNLRASLDYLVWQLALAAGNVPSERNAFPVVRSFKDWTGVRGDRLKGVDDRWVNKVRDVQPFHAPNPDHHLLALLDVSNNVLKHRLLAPILVTFDEITWEHTVEPPGRSRDRQEVSTGAAATDGAEIYRFRYVPPAPSKIRSVQGPGINISFVAGADVPWDVLTLIEWVASTIRAFDPAFSYANTR